MGEGSQRRQAVYLKPSVAPDARRHAARRWGTWLLAGLLTVGIGGDVGATESLQHWRKAFQTAEQSLRNGTPLDYSSLRNYPLYPYLRYQDLSRRLDAFPAAEVRDFLQTHPDTPLAGRLRNTWLRQLASARRWDDYLHDAVPSRDPLLECWRRQALLSTGQSEAALHDFTTLWLSGSALPSACDPVIAAWQTQGNPLPKLRWQRFALAMTNNDLGLARFLRADMPDADREWANAWLAVVDHPALILEAERFKSGDPRTPAILADGLRRWLRRDALAAVAAFDTLKERDPTLALSLAEVERQLALWIASDYHPAAMARLQALPETVVDQDVREWRIRLSLRQGDWAGVLREIEAMPPAERDSPRWQYWRGRALDALGRGEEARSAYRRIASQRDYHGFLAADRLGVAYAMTNTPLEISPTELDVLLAGSPGLQRARELYILGREAEAEAEWRLATQTFNRAALQQAARLAHRWDWRYQAMATVARAGHWDDLELRFPLIYRDRVLASAASPVDPAWVYAVIRQESSFRSDARSPVGALGLMQIMPATGRQIARELRDADPPDLLQPETNIRYGAHYLQQILQRLQNNPVLATAAYNAGPNKVMQWLPSGDPTPADVWAETIPYRETRAYVQRVMEYAAVYRFLLGLQDSETTLSARMKPVLPESANRAG
ncbi:MAG TPA: transglycosylase SLT domain-containing protein [Candidatus Competibacteraceae bacterium]|nr:transglycosylase SLT domain-containing protein [Candidatus Competibacteraceae bacterium]HRZ05849.1 transglycosylase SLT domain-containing protein [Candidatus Competibacteraceae bacterium]HSA47100.1 transglycosylase SLT domain-containing protein [Candidatus Competibacteraceae bacterium]